MEGREGIVGVYDCRYRVLLQHVAALLCVPWESVEGVEEKVAHLLIQQTYVESESVPSSLIVVLFFSPCRSGIKNQVLRLGEMGIKRA